MTDLEKLGVLIAIQVYLDCSNQESRLLAALLLTERRLNMFDFRVAMSWPDRRSKANTVSVILNRITSKMRDRGCPAEVVRHEIGRNRLEYTLNNKAELWALIHQAANLAVPPGMDDDQRVDVVVY